MAAALLTPSVINKIHTLFSLIIVILFFTRSVKASLTLEDVLPLFENCTVKLHYYRTTNWAISTTPVLIQTDDSFKLDDLRRIPDGFPSYCLALFYIVPLLGARITRDEDQTPVQNAKKLRKRELNGFQDDFERMDTRLRYDVLVDHNNEATTEFVDKHRNVYLSGINSQALILKTSHQETLSIRDKIGIVNRLQLTNSVTLVQSRSITEFLGGDGRQRLQNAIDDVNDVTNNPTVKWSLQSFQHGSIHPGLADAIRREMSGSKFKYISLAQRIAPRSARQESLVNFAFAVMALGYNVSLEQSTGYSSLDPTIIFDVANGEIMRQLGRKFGYVTCSTAGGGGYRQTGFFDVFIEFISVFDIRIYSCLVATYVAPCVILGWLYHGFLRKRIQEKYWIKWDPFTWGMRALILQAGDRRWNSKRFGFAAWMVVPWLLMAVIISHSFRGRNMRILVSASGMFIGPSTWRLLHSDVKIMTDHPILGMEWTMMPGNSYAQIGELINGDPSILFVSYKERTKAIANRVGGMSRWSRGMCENNWEQARTGDIDYWNAGRLLKNWKSRLMLMGDTATGWKVERWGDNRLHRRLKWLEGPSGIVAKWRAEVKKASLGDQDDAFRYRWYIGPASMWGNLKWVFIIGLCALGICLIFWVGERVFWKVYTQPMRRREEKNKKSAAEDDEMSDGKTQVVFEEPKFKPIENEDSDIEMDESLSKDEFVLNQRRKRSLVWAENENMKKVVEMGCQEIATEYSLGAGIQNRRCSIGGILGIGDMNDNSHGIQTEDMDDKMSESDGSELESELHSLNVDSDVVLSDVEDDFSGSYTLSSSQKDPVPSKNQ